MRVIQKIKVVNTLKDMTDKIYENQVKEYSLTKNDLETIVKFLEENRFEVFIDESEKQKLPIEFRMNSIAISPNRLN